MVWDPEAQAYSYWAKVSSKHNSYVLDWNLLQSWGADLWQPYIITASAVLDGW